MSDSAPSLFALGTWVAGRFSFWSEETVPGILETTLAQCAHGMHALFRLKDTRSACNDCEVDSKE
jgi:hypothetical protein